jgi:hypothetical protein
LRFASLANSEPLIIPGGIGAHGLSGFAPEPFGLATEVTVNFTIPGFCFLAKHFCDKEIYAVPVAGILGASYSFIAKQEKALATNIIGSKRLKRFS